MSERERIEELHQKYISLRENTPMMHRNGDECKAYHDWYDAAYIYFKSFGCLKNDPDYQTFVDAEKDGNCFVLAHVYDSIRPSYKVLMQKTGNIHKTDDEIPGVKPPMVFISHAELDKEFANEIVTLLEFIGVKGKGKLLCTSVDGYRIPVGHDIVEYLREVFNNYDLFVIILHTHNYYTRPVCLNEMGAAWALKTKYYSVLASDFDFNEMTGVVNNKDVAIKIGAEDCEARVNQLKNAVVDFFELSQPDEDRWPHYRCNFINKCLKFKSPKSELKPENAPKGIPICDDSLMALSTSFKVFQEKDGLFPFQIDVKFAAQKNDVYLKSVKLLNKKRAVELDGYGAEDDILNLRKYLNLNTLDIEKTKRKDYRNSIDELYKTCSIYVEDHKLANSVLETMSFHGTIGLRLQMDGYDDLDLDGWELYVTYNVIGELTIPLQIKMLI